VPKPSQKEKPAQEQSPALKSTHSLFLACTPSQQHIGPSPSIDWYRASLLLSFLPSFSLQIVRVLIITQVAPYPFSGLAATNNLLRVTPRQGKNLVFVATLVPYSSRSALKRDRAQLKFIHKCRLLQHKLLRPSIR